MARRDEYDDERVVVVEQGGSAGIGMLLLGLAVGAGAALLMAPASGRETRERLQREARRAGKKVRDLTNEVGDELAGRVERTRASFDDRVERARSAVRARRQAMGDAVAVGREGAAKAREDLSQAVIDAKRAYAETRRAYRDAMREQAEYDDEQDVASDDAPVGAGKDATEQAPRDG